MNTLTRKIKMKGYKIEEFLAIINISLSSYRKYEAVNHPEHEWLCEQIDKIEHKGAKISVENIDECTCDNEYVEEHSCPKKSDVENDSESLCTCCEYCESNCHDDI